MAPKAIVSNAASKGLAPGYASKAGPVGSSSAGSSNGGKTATSAAPAPAVVTYTITNKNTGKTSTMTADQLKSMQGTQGLANFADSLKNGTISVSSGGKDINPFSSAAAPANNGSATPVKQTFLGADPGLTPTVTTPAPQLGAKYDAATPSNENTASDAAAKMTAMQKGVTTVTAPNGKSYEITPTADGKVTFTSKSTGLPVTMDNVEQATTYINQKNPAPAEVTGMKQQMNAADENADTLFDAQKKANEESQAEKNTNIDTYNQVSAEDQAKLAALAAQRQANINAAQATMVENNKKALEGNERLVRLQSNEHLTTIIQQYMAKGMTEEEARTQAQSDIESQLQKERQTILTAEKDNATLQNQVAQWGANAQDVISQAQESNAKANTATAQSVANMKNEAETGEQSAENQAYANTIQSVNLANYNTLTDLEKQKVLNTLGINQAMGNPKLAAEQFITTMGAFAEKNKTRFAAMLRDILAGRKGLAEAQAGLFGSAPSTATHTAAPAVSNITIGSTTGVSPR